MEEVDRYYQGNITLEEAENYIASGLVTAARAYVANGYYLRRIRDDRLYEEAGYKNFEEYVRDKYNKDKGWASKCIKVNQELSADGNSPILISNYQDYSVYQLVEIAYMAEEQRKEADPDMTVQALKEIRNPRPRVEEKVVTSQLEERSVEPEPDAEAQQTEEFIAISQQKSEEQTPEPEELYFTLENHLTLDGAYGACLAMVVKTYLENLNSRGLQPMSDDVQDIAVQAMGLEYLVMMGREFAEFKREGSIPVNVERKRLQEEFDYWYPAPKPEPQPQEWNPTPTPCVHREGYSCTVPETQKHIVGDGSNCGQSCCWKCTKRGECKWECNCSASRPAEPEPEPVEERKQIGDMELSSRTEDTLKRAGIDTIEGLVSMSDEELAAVRGMSNRSMEEIKTKLEDIVSADKTEPEPENGNPTDMEIAQQELDRANNLLKKCLKDVPDETNVFIRGMKLKVAALASFVCDLDNIENPAPKPEQPELPLLKNNDQRAAFVDAYETWPLWIETAETGERYYRYDLPDGTSMVVKVYRAMIFTGYADGSYKSMYHDGYGRHEYYLLMPGKFFRDCESNRSTLIDKLKEIQKKEKT